MISNVVLPVVMSLVMAFFVAKLTIQSVRRSKRALAKLDTSGRWAFDPFYKKMHCPHGSFKLCITCGDVREIIREAHGGMDCEACGLVTVIAAQPLRPTEDILAYTEKQIVAVHAVPSHIIGTNEHVGSCHCCEQPYRRRTYLTMVNRRGLGL